MELKLENLSLEKNSKTHKYKKTRQKKEKKNKFLLYNLEYNYHYESPVKAAGILFYTIKDGKKYFLMTETDKKLSDIGGKIEDNDEKILDIAIREFSEETNGNLYEKKEGDNENKIKELIIFLKNNINIENSFYISKAKYVIFIGILPTYLMDLHSSINFFDDKEYKENRERKIFWINIDQILEYKKNNSIHPRLWNNKLWTKVFGEKLIEINNEKDDNHKFLFKKDK